MNKHELLLDDLDEIEGEEVQVVNVIYLINDIVKDGQELKKMVQEY